MFQIPFPTTQGRHDLDLKNGRTGAAGAEARRTDRTPPATDSRLSAFPPHVRAANGDARPLGGVASFGLSQGGGEEMRKSMTDSLAERRPGRPVGEEMRRRAVAAVVEKGMSARAVGRLFDVADVSVSRWVRAYLDGGRLRAKRMGGRASRIEPERERIFRILEARPAISARKLREALAAEGLEFGQSTVQRFLRRHGLQRELRLARLHARNKAR